MSTKSSIYRCQYCQSIVPPGQQHACLQLQQMQAAQQKAQQQTLEAQQLAARQNAIQQNPLIYTNELLEEIKDLMKTQKDLQDEIRMYIRLLAWIVAGALLITALTAIIMTAPK